MWDFLTTPVAQTVIWSSAGLVLLLVGVFLVRSFRDRIGQAPPSTHELLTNFRELHQVGDISDAEFRTIKTRLGAKIQDELKDSDGKG